MIKTTAQPFRISVFGTQNINFAFLYEIFALTTVSFLLMIQMNQDSGQFQIDNN